MTYQSFNPATGELLKKFDELTEVQLEAKLAKASECFARWKNTSYAERAKIIAKAGTLLQDRVEDLAKTMTLEMGKRIEEARGRSRIFCEDHGLSRQERRSVPRRYQAEP